MLSFAIVNTFENKVGKVTKTLIGKLASLFQLYTLGLFN